MKPTKSNALLLLDQFFIQPHLLRSLSNQKRSDTSAKIIITITKKGFMATLPPSLN